VRFVPRLHPAQWFTPLTFPSSDSSGWRITPERIVVLLLGVFTLCSANVATYAPPRASIPQDMLAVTVLDVGQGDAILIEHPDRGTVLIDTGPPPYDARSGLVPYLLRRGISAVEIVLITHSHADHAGGLESLRSAIHVQRRHTPLRSPARSFHGG
jgi:competence protein ComEC